MKPYLRLMVEYREDFIYVAKYLVPICSSSILTSHSTSIDTDVIFSTWKHNKQKCGCLKISKMRTYNTSFHTNT